MSDTQKVPNPPIPVNVEPVYYRDAALARVRVFGFVGGWPYSASLDGDTWRGAADDTARARLAADSLYAVYQAENGQTVPGFRRVFTYSSGG